MILSSLRRPFASTLLGAIALLAACSSGNGNNGSADSGCSGSDCAPTCSGGKVACGGNCVDTQSDALNCGGCGQACTQGAACVGGSCACQSGLRLCDVDGGAAVCTDTSSDPKQCGTCGNACGADETCIGGACICPGGDIQCSGVCTDPMTSIQHCGAMNDCDADAGSAGAACTTTQFCKTGACSPCAMWTAVRRVPVSAYPNNPTTADLNGDGNLDLLVYGNVAGQRGADVLLGRGDGTFEAVQNLLTSGNYYGTGTNGAVADFDGDGKLDVLQAGSVVVLKPIYHFDTSIYIYYGYGDGTFNPNAQVIPVGPAVPGAVGADLGYPTIGDFDGDGKPDVVLIGFNGEGPTYYGFEVFLNKGPRAFSPVTFVQTGQDDPSHWPRSVTVADVNADGKVDVLLGDDGSQASPPVVSQVEVWLGHGDGTFTQKASYPVGSIELGLATADFNGDGKLDLATADLRGASVLLGHGDGTFAPPTGLLSSGEVAQVVPKDVSGDGITDLVLGGAASDSFAIDTQLEVRVGLGDGSFYPADTYPGGQGGIAVADVSGHAKRGDHFVDILAAGAGQENAVIVYIGGKHPECK